MVHLLIFFAVGTGFEPVGRFRPMVFLTTMAFATKQHTPIDVHFHFYSFVCGLDSLLTILKSCKFILSMRFLWSPISPATHINFNLGSFYIVSTHCLLIYNRVLNLYHLHTRASFLGCSPRLDNIGSVLAYICYNST